MAQRKKVPSAKAQKSVEKEKNSALIVISAAIAILLELCLFGILGSVGHGIAYAEFGLFGIMAYVFPLAGFAIILYQHLAKADSKKNIICAIIIFVFLCAFMHLVSFPDMENATVGDYFVRAANERIGGGILGGLLSIALVLVISKVGAYIVVILAILVCLFLICGKSIIKSAKQIVGQGRVDDDDDDDEEPDKRVIPRSRLSAFAPRRELPVYEIDDDEGRTIRIVNAVKPHQRNRAELKRSVNKAAPYRDGSTELLRSSAGIKGVNSNLSFTPNNASGDEMHEITNIKVERSCEQSGSEVIDEPLKTIEITDVPDFKGEKPKATKPKRAKAIESTVVSGVSMAKVASDTIDRKQPQKEAPKTRTTTRVKSNGKYQYPPIELLTKGRGRGIGVSKTELNRMASNLETILAEFGVNATVIDKQAGPSVTRFELQPELGIRVSKITSLADDLKLNLAVPDIRIEAPIPGRAAVGIEIPNSSSQSVLIRDLIESDELKNEDSKIAIAAGVDISGNVVVADIDKMPHILIAGTTGSGKSVFTKSLLMTIIYRARPEEVGVIIIDPKKVEFNDFSGIPHMMKDVVTDAGQAVSTLRWAVNEMQNRYQRMQLSGVNDIKSYNAYFEQGKLNPEEENPRKMQQIIIIIDELADLMLTASKEVESLIVRLAQLARAAGMHLIIATQRPSANVVTGLIKANVPSKVALRVTSKLESRIILDMQGAEELLGHGDMLFFPNGFTKPVRVQGAMISEQEVKKVTRFLKENKGDDIYALESEEIQKYINNSQDGQTSFGSSDDSSADKLDDYIFEAGKLCIEAGKASSSMLQRRFSIGFNRAARIIDQLCDLGVVGPANGAKPREILVDSYEFEMMLQSKDE